MSFATLGSAATQVIKSITPIAITVTTGAGPALYSSDQAISAVNVNKAFISLTGTTANFVAYTGGGRLTLVNATTVRASFFNVTGVASDIVFSGFVIEYK